MEIIGIDPAPGKKSAVYVPRIGFAEFSPSELGEFLTTCHGGDVLLCWDAPLTGTRDPDGPISDEKGDHTKRAIERWLSRAYPKMPDGISVQGYAGCQHWTITRRLLGLPRVGIYDSTEIPFRLAAEPLAPPTAKAWVVEVHPALAMWLWLKGPPTGEERRTWRYKGAARGAQKAVQNVDPADLFEALEKRLGSMAPQLADAFVVARNGLEKKDPLTPDRLDAFVAWLLGHLWLNPLAIADETARVHLYGDKRTGAMLLPATQTQPAP